MIANIKNAPAAEAILEFWRAVEYFTPPKIDTQSSDGNTEKHFPVKCNADFPWVNSREKEMIDDQEYYWRHTLYFGVINVDTVIDEMEQKLCPDAPPEFKEAGNGKCCLACVDVASHGRSIEKSFTPASFIWAMGRLLKTKARLNLEGFDSFAIQSREDFDRRAANRTAPVDFDEIQNELDQLVSTAGWKPRDILKEVYTISRKMRRSEKEKDKTPQRQDILNSFIANDLGLVGTALQSNNIGSALRTYLSDSIPAQRIDVQENASVAQTFLRPENFPSGRWPAAETEPLVLSQQLAVNVIKKTLWKNPGLLAVNGPPGTGKTTLLRDIIADVLVARAQVLCEFTAPSDAFTQTSDALSVGSKALRCYNLDPRLLDFGMVVACSNNGAAENVTREIPARKEIAPRLRAELDYFSEVSNHVFQSDDTWGMIAAVLGNSTNRSAFVTRFWFAKASAERPRDISFQHAMANPTHIPVWADAVANFNSALAELTQEQNALQALALIIENQPALRAASRDAHEQAQLQQAQLAALTEQLAQLNHKFSGASEDQRASATLLDAIKTVQPGFFSKLFRTARYREWESRMLEESQRYSILARSIAVLRAQRDDTEKKVSAAQRACRAASTQAQQTALELTQSVDAIEDGRTRFGQHFPDSNFWSLADTQRQTLSPWSDAGGFTKLRSHVFVAAIELHKAFVYGAAAQMKSNLGLAADLVAGKLSAREHGHTFTHLWSTLFLTVPVVSTTFASFGRLFAGMGRESLGWLFVDEAGQATPQSVTGALWRSKRAVIIGDPLQIEPVVTLPGAIVKMLSADYGVNSDWNPRNQSVQKLADRQSRLGTSFKHIDPPWVGLPLRVHRRCVNPMFEISNQIAYDGFMVLATQSGPGKIERRLGESRWFDIREQADSRHWIAAEGKVVLYLLGEIHAETNSLLGAFVISPFKTVISGFKDYAWKHAASVNIRPKAIAEWRKQHCGTVHTFQGKQNEAVILLLGGNPNSDSALLWASGTPNVLNVAVTRAKRRIYVVGNRERWSKMPYFDKLSAALPIDREFLQS